MFLKGLLAGKVFERFSALLQSNCLFGTLVSFCDIHGLVRLLVDTLSLHVVKLAVDILAEVFSLDTLPLITIELYGVKSEADLLSSELTVLAKGVEANDVLDLGG